MTVSSGASERATDARARLLEAALRCAVRDGSGALSLQSIASEASVSKALILYHFRGKEQLLATIIEWLTERILSREVVALAESSAMSVLDDYWRWLAAELKAGELGVLVELTQERGADAVAALAASAHRRHETAEGTITRVFNLLGLSPRLAVPMLGACELAFRDGLVVGAAREPDRNVRVAFDVFWLSLLSLAK
ncbi:MAG: TetR/AcrR family transcriptional regulator [Gemmatimonadaceae bacterium]